MASELKEGSRFLEHYVLDRELTASVWIATHEQTGDRALIRIYDASAVANVWAQIDQSVTRLRGLVHEHISVATLAAREGDYCFLVEPYISGARRLTLSGDNPWASLKPVIDAIEYAHKLGLVHGNLHNGNLLLGDDGRVRITGFGVPASLSNTADSNDAISPQVTAGKQADTTDDIYSLGCLIFRSLTGKSWQHDVEINTPLPEELDLLLRQMTSESPFARTVELIDIRDALNKHFDNDAGAIKSVSFSRQQPESPKDVESIPVPIARQRQAISTPKVMGGALVLLIAAALLFLILPENASQVPVSAAGSGNTGTQPVSQSPPPGPPITTPFEIAQFEFMQAEGERLAKEVLRAQLDLEDIGVQLWAQADYQLAQDHLNQADNEYRESRFDQALTMYKQVLQELEQLISRAPAVLEEQIAIGDAALQTGDSKTALVAFTIATSLESGDNSLKKKLQRAENLDEVKRQTRQADALERNGELRQAREIFQSAYNLDPDWPPAEQGLERARAGIRQLNFRSAMSSAFNAIDQKEYTAAQNYFTDAKKILPGSTEPADGLLQVEQAERNDIILRHRQDAEAHLANDAWQLAINEFNHALGITDTLEFAIEGREYATNRLELAAKLQRYLGDPTVLQANDELATASLAFREAARIEQQSPEMMQHIDTLARLISTARIEISVTIFSDEKTDVTIRRHSNLGKITSTVVGLIPGRYTIVGVRPGYRDVREDFILLAGTQAPDITIASSEKIR